MAPASGGWYRAVTVIYYEDQDEVLVRFVDYGGYSRIPRADLRQIRFAHFFFREGKGEGDTLFTLLKGLIIFAIWKFVNYFITFKFVFRINCIWLS